MDQRRLGCGLEASSSPNGRGAGTWSSRSRSGGWTRARGLDWGSARPFAVLWAAVVQDTFEHDGRMLPRGALVIYREYYGMQRGKPNVGLKLPAEEVAREIVKRETRNGKHERINYGIADPACSAVISGPSIAETLMRVASLSAAPTTPGCRSPRRWAAGASCAAA